jgi:hypothetical protein
MPTICPNCLQPVRAEARYCGFCGSNLNPAALDEASAVLPVPKKEQDSAQEGKPKVKPKADSAIVRRRILIFIIILLLLVLLATFIIHFWPQISQSAGSIMGLILLR